MPKRTAEPATLGYLLVCADDVRIARQGGRPAVLLGTSSQPLWTASDLGEARDLASRLARIRYRDDVVIVELREVERVPSAVK